MLSLLPPRPLQDTLCDRECDWESPVSPYLASTHTRRSSQPPLSKPLGGLNRAIVGAQQKCDRGRDSQPRPWPWLNSQPQVPSKSLQWWACHWPPGCRFQNGLGKDYFSRQSRFHASRPRSCGWQVQLPKPRSLPVPCRQDIEKPWFLAGIFLTNVPCILGVICGHLV